MDLSGMNSGLDIASDLAATSLQNPEEALAQARDEVESASQEASDDRSSSGHRAPGGHRAPSDPSTDTTSLPTTGGTYGRYGYRSDDGGIPPSVPPSRRG